MLEVREKVLNGNRVSLFNSVTKKEGAWKLMSPWLGPFVIVDKISCVNYKIGPKNALGQKQVVHCNRLKFCKHRKMCAKTV